MFGSSALCGLRISSVYTYISDLKVLPHEQVKRGWGVTSDWGDATAAVAQQTKAQVGTKLSVLFKQHLWELSTNQYSFCYDVLSILFFVAGDAAKMIYLLLLTTKGTLKTRALCVVKQCCRKRALWLLAMLWRRTLSTPPSTLSFSSDATTVCKKK